MTLLKGNSIDRVKQVTAVFFLGVCFVAIKPASAALASDPIVLAKNHLEDIAIKERQVVEINRSFKNAIEENQKLIDQNHSLQSELKRLRAQTMEQQNVVVEVQRERDQLAKVVNQAQEANSKYETEIKGLQQNLDMLKVARNESSEGYISSPVVSDWSSDEEIIQLAANTPQEVVEQEAKTLDILSTIDAFTETDERLRMDSAKAHYNMGNIYYQRGEFEIAAREYYQAVTLMPDDPDAHYNLAFVSAEHLDDHATALRHYRMYLYLNPNASDLHRVKERILHSQLILDSKINSPMEEREK